VVGKPAPRHGQAWTHGLALSWKGIREVTIKKNNNIIGLDIGYRNTKATAGKTSICFPSVEGYPEEIKYEGGILNNGAGPSSVQNIKLITDKGLRFIGDLALKQSKIWWTPQQRDRSSKSDIVLNLALAAISELGLSGEIKIVTGLPPDWFEENDRQALRKKLLGEHVIRREGVTEVKIDVTEIEVKPQPFGTFYRQMLTAENGKVKVKDRSLANVRVGLIDVGGHTTDLSLSDQMTYLNNASGSIEYGMSDVYDQIIKAIKREFRTTIDAFEAEQVLRSETIRIQGKPHKIGKLIDAILDVAINPVRDKAIALWGDGNLIDVVLGTGGGAPDLLPLLMDTYPHLTIVENSVLANAQGFYLFGSLKWQ
jgi:hypothetical protein